MRSIETLAKLYPDLTGKQIVELHEKENSDEQLQRNEEVIKKLKYITNENNVSYFEGSYGKDARYSKISNAKIIGNVIYADIEIISIDDKIKTQISSYKEYSFNIEKQLFNQVDISSFYYHFANKSTGSEWNRICKYLKDVKDFYNYYKIEE